MCYIFITYQAFLYEWLLSSHYRLYNIEGLQLVFSPKTHQHRPRAFQGSEGLEHSWSFSLPSWKNNLFSIINFLDYKTFVIHHCIVFSASKMSFQSFHEVWAQLPCWYFGSQLSRVNFIRNVLFRDRLFSSALSLLVHHVSCFSNSYLRGFTCWCTWEVLVLSLEILLSQDVVKISSGSPCNNHLRNIGNNICNDVIARQC